jgi:hypothetical protein
VEVKIGVQHSPRELVIDSPKTPDEIAAEVAKAMSGATKDGLLTLVDDRGRRLLVPVDRIAYVEIAQADQRAWASSPVADALARVRPDGASSDPRTTPRLCPASRV